MTTHPNFRLSLGMVILALVVLGAGAVASFNSPAASPRPHADSTTSPASVEAAAGDTGDVR